MPILWIGEEGIYKRVQIVGRPNILIIFNYLPPERRGKEEAKFRRTVKVLTRNRQYGGEGSDAVALLAVVPISMPLVSSDSPPSTAPYELSRIESIDWVAQLL